jgi:hypothetical protein
MIVPSCSVGDKTGAFVRLNSARVTGNSFHMYWSRVAAGNPTSVLTKSVCDRAGVTICKYPKDLRSIGPGKTMALAVIQAAIRNFEPPVVILALSAMVAAFREERAQLRAVFIKGVCTFVFRHTVGVDKERLKAALEGMDAEDTEIAARAERKLNGGAVPDIIAAWVGK